MPRGEILTLTENAAVGLFYMQRYRFLTIDQYARAGNLNRSTARDQLRHMQRHGMLGYFGNTGLGGRGKTPKTYFLTRKGWDMLLRDSDIPEEILGSYKEVKVDSRWSPQMYHRLRTVDLMIAAELAILSRPHLSFVASFIEYRQVKRGMKVTKETTDYIGEEESAQNRIIPDASFIIENRETGRRALFLLEIDMATEPIMSRINYEKRSNLHFKMKQYDRYLTGGRFAKTYAPFGDFRFFTLLFITHTWQRIENIREETQDLPASLSDYYRFTTFEHALEDFFGKIWKSRVMNDAAIYPLVREGSSVTK